MRNKLRMYIFTLLTILLSMGTANSIAEAVSFSSSGTYVYDVNGRIVTFMSKDDTTISYQYDRNGNLLKKVPVQILGYMDSPSTIYHRNKLPLCACERMVP
ncbi:RHS repeat domain-containing protein [Paenibacillus sp. FSL R7-0204]|uniref:RHS repeat domain-containing protein n=1 Tax=Paenibacillus sp. FSL R7-0204 TaxID=2921675 RepID=UPI0030FCBA23